jgi:hypothetical protein
MNEESKARIAEAQRRKWADRRASQGKVVSIAVSGDASDPGSRVRRMSADGQARIAAQKSAPGRDKVQPN